MQIRFEIPDRFWGLFRSPNREVYMEALLEINKEYEYSNYYLTREVCVQVLADMMRRKTYILSREEDETEMEILDTPAHRVLSRLIASGWLKKVEDYQALVTNIVIPDYAAVFVDAFGRLVSEDMEETEIYIQNVYATLYSFQNNPRVNLNMLRTALVNTRRLNKALQDMLHNMDKFFSRLLEQQFYGDLLKEHLDGYVEEIVRKKYHILKTTDNFYIYKNDIKKCLRTMKEDDEWIEKIRKKAAATGDVEDDVVELLDLLERGFDDIEHRISNMDREHTRYVRATVTRMNYLLSGESDTKGLVAQLLNLMAEDEEKGKKAGEKMNLSLLEIFSEKSLYKRRRGRRDFISKMAQEEDQADLDREDVLKLNRIQRRFSKKQIEDFIEENMQDEVMDSRTVPLANEEAFEKLILAYDYCTRKNSKYSVVDGHEMIEKNGYRYPALQFVRKSL